MTQNRIFTVQALAMETGLSVTLIRQCINAVANGDQATAGDTVAMRNTPACETLSGPGRG